MKSHSSDSTVSRSEISLEEILRVLPRTNPCFNNVPFPLCVGRYADRSYRTHPRGLIIYGPATVPNLLAAGNASSTTTIPSIPAKGVSNSSRSEPAPTRNLANGTARELSVANSNASNNATTLPRCPLIPPNLGECLGKFVEQRDETRVRFLLSPSPTPLHLRCCSSRTGGRQ